MSARMSLRRIRQEKMWSAALVILLTIGVSTWLIIPSINASLQDGFFKYGESASTYIQVSYSLSYLPSAPRLLANVTDKVAAIQGVEEFYPIVINSTSFCFTMPMGNRNATFNLEEETVVIGGPTGYPEASVSLGSGRMPGDGEAAFLMSETSFMNVGIKVGQTYTVRLADYAFNATFVGTPLTKRAVGMMYLFWNSTFLQQKLGSQLYEQTFGVRE